MLSVARFFFTTKTMGKIDLKKLDKAYYTASRKPELREIGAAQYLSILGQGDPDGETYAEKVQALFTVAYTLKFAVKTGGRDFVMPKLEGLWWFDESRFGHVSLEEAPQLIPRSEWQWRMMIRMPDFINPQHLQQAIEQVLEKKQLEMAREVVWYESPPERVVQIMHLGPFDREPETLQLLQQFVEERGLQKAGLHHEIYLSDITRADPEKWRTILREPVC